MRCGYCARFSGTDDFCESGCAPSPVAVLCRGCSTVLAVDVAAVSLYCSSRCRRVHAKRVKVLGAAIAPQHPRDTVLTSNCGYCRAVFAVPSGAGSTKRYCSATCRGRASEAAKVDLQVKIQAALAANRPPQASRIPCTVCRTPAKASLSNRAPHCSADCRAYSEYIAGARFYAVRIGRRQGGYVRIDTVEAKK